MVRTNCPVAWNNSDKTTTEGKGKLVGLPFVQDIRLRYSKRLDSL